MDETHPDPPLAARALLRQFLRSADVESVPGDLLEEYREVRRPTLGKHRADRWYARQVGGIIWRVVWPCVLAVSALRILSFPLPAGWNPSLVQAPGVSVLDAALFAAVGHYGARRTGRFTSGVLMAVLTGAVGCAMFFADAAVRMPSLLAAPFEKPFIFVIIAIVLAIALAFAAVAGALGAASSRWFRPAPERIQAS